MPVITALTEHRQTRRQLARALGAGGIGVHFVDQPGGVAKAVASAGSDLLIIDTDHVEADAIAAALEQQRGLAEPVPVILVSLGANKRPLLELLQRHEVDNLVAKHGALRAAFPIVDERELLVTCQKMVRRDIFGIEKYLGSWGVEIHRATITSLADKSDFVNQFEGFLTDLDCPNTVVPDILTAAEELVMNAIVHAPRDEAGNPKYESALPMGAHFTLGPAEHVQVAFGCDGQRLMLSVADPFGALSRDTIYAYVAKGFSENKMVVETKPGGAGLGLSMAFLSMHQLVFNVQAKVRTEVIAGWYLRVSTAAEFRQVGKSLNLFWLPQDSRPLVPPPEPRPPTRPAMVPLAERRPDVLIGRVDESVDLSGVKPGTRLNLARVSGFTSRGVVVWLHFARSIQGEPVRLVGCPEPLVRLAVEVEGVLHGMAVESVLVPFACSGCEAEQNVELPLEQMLKPPPAPCSSCGGALQFNGIPEEFEAFYRLARGDER